MATNTKYGGAGVATLWCFVSTGVTAGLPCKICATSGPTASQLVGVAQQDANDYGMAAVDLFVGPVYKMYVHPENAASTVSALTVGQRVYVKGSAASQRLVALDSTSTIFGFYLGRFGVDTDTYFSAGSGPVQAGQLIIPTSLSATSSDCAVALFPQQPSDT